MTLVVDTNPTATRRPHVEAPDLRTKDPVRYARACRARAVVLDLGGHHKEAQHQRDLADTNDRPSEENHG